MSAPEKVITTDDRRKTFFRTLFSNAKGLLCLAFIDGTDKKSFRESFYHYPEQIDLILEDINENINENVYFCPQLFREKKRRKECVEATPNIWADLDHCEPGNMLVEPTIVLESSPGRFQAFWTLSEDTDPDDAENTAQRIAYRHAEQGADRSGWDLTQLLRVPYTMNYKYINAPIVKPVAGKALRYKITDFDELYPQVSEYIRVDVPKPDIDMTQNPLEVLGSAGQKINPMIWELYNTTPPENQWSEKLWQLLLLLLENNFGPEQAYIIAMSAGCNKYARDGRPALQLWKDVCRADMRYRMQERIAFGKKGDFATKQYDLLTEEERVIVAAQPESFVERYISWASSLGDAATQYHQAGAFIALSSILCGSVRLPTSYGVIIPNLWFMILADTTLTRKSTAMDICTDLLEEVDDEIIMATDGSIEGLMTGLSTRANRPSIFLRDEFSGLVEQMNKKDYMSGMPELLTKLYDGKMQRRQLRRETIEIKAPRFIIFGGGIRNATTAAMSTDMIASGFIPRFIFITAESDISKVKPIGPPTTANLAERERIGAELMKLHMFYNSEHETMLPDTDIVLRQKKMFDVTLTPAAWDRYNRLEYELTQYGLNSSKPDVYTPVGDRLAKSILKAAILLTASKETVEDIVIDVGDILKAISYGEKWFMHTRAIVDSVGMGASERMLAEIVKACAREEEGLPRSAVMTNFRLNSREVALVKDTLEQRGLITVRKAGRGEVWVAMNDADLMAMHEG